MKHVRINFAGVSIKNCGGAAGTWSSRAWRMARRELRVWFV